MTVIDRSQKLLKPPLSSSKVRLPAASRKRLLVFDVLIVACWVSTGVAVALYLSSGGLAAVVDPGTALEGAGIVAGLIGTNLILIMLVLAARIPLIDRAVGQDRAMILHGKLGKPALLLLIAHGLLLTVAYSLENGDGIVSETAALLGTPDMPTAYVGLGLMLVVVGTSIVAVRKRLPYEVWHAIHLVSYAAVVVALPHQLSAGAVLGEGTLQRTYWITLYVVAFASILVFRFVRPIVATLKHSFRVLAVERVSNDVVSIYLSGDNLDAFQAVGGQYAVWRFWSRGTWWHAHPLSFSAAPNPAAVRVTLKVSGAGTRAIAGVKPGTRVSFAGPYGTFTSKTRTSPYLSIMSAGIGVTPVRALLEHSALRPGEATILLRGSDSSQTYLWGEVERLAQLTGSSISAMVGRRASGQSSWMSAEAASNGVSLLSLFPHLLESDFYFCGPKGWANAVLLEARAAGLQPHQIHVERFD
ncbi:oxidoreductase [Leucobacter coleopterorum]|uniref:Oxidoreductase n=1 Tax=Leucobacter coleopterorum TaxID=2714933 RepID=A0ABX6JYM6_9MICO|nr:ferredoxin reductase family protein [Leucobacter coleopterorum]QIM17954.1 oxidoreductase [Leucobacter coleopterorum]